MEDTGSAVSYYANAGEEKTLLCRARFSPGAVAVENGAGETVGIISNSQVADHGYASVMCHFADATLDNFTVETAPYEAGRVDEENGVRTTTYDFNTDKNTLMKDINLVSQQPNMLIENGKLVNHKSDNTWFDLCFTLPYGYASGYEVAMDISATGADGWVQGYLLGVRLSEPYRIYLNGNALWAILNDDSITFVGPNSNNDASKSVRVSGLPINFQNETRFYIKDNMDTIEYYADADGVKTLLATAQIGENSVTIKNAGGTSAGVLQNVTLQKTGALNTMSHFAETTLDNVTFTVDAATVGGETPPYTTRDLYTDTWVATDDLGRKTPLYGDDGVPALKEDKKVGIFYFTWHTKEMDKNLTGDRKKVFTTIPRPMPKAAWMACGKKCCKAPWVMATTGPSPISATTAPTTNGLFESTPPCWQTPASTFCLSTPPTICFTWTKSIKYSTFMPKCAKRASPRPSSCFSAATGRLCRQRPAYGLGRLLSGPAV